MKRVLPKYQDGTDSDEPVIERGTRYSPIGGDFIWRLNPINEMKWRLYRNLSPYSYHDFENRAKSAVIDNKAEMPAMQSENLNDDPRDDQFATYLGIPKEMRRLNVRKLLPAIYHPQNEDTSISLYRMPLTKKEIDQFVMSQYPYPAGTTIIDPDTRQSKNLGMLPFGSNILVSGIFDEATKAFPSMFGSYTEGRGVDRNRGEYFSYYDRYDLNPLYGENGGASDFFNNLPKWYLDRLKKTGDIGINSGITHPFAIYDRIYLNDYYGVKDSDIAPDKGDYYGGWLPPIKVSPGVEYYLNKEKNK